MTIMDCVSKHLKCERCDVPLEQLLIDEALPKKNIIVIFMHMNYYDALYLGI